MKNMKNMKNREILLDVIGDTDEKLIPDLSPKRKPNRILKWAAVGGVCAAAVIACAIVLPKTVKDGFSGSGISRNAGLPRCGFRPRRKFVRCMGQGANGSQKAAQRLSEWVQ